MHEQISLSMLKAFVAVASNKSMVRAVDTLRISQPAISMKLAKLAKIVGGDLFIDTRSYVLTKIGERLFSESRMILDLLDALPNMAAQKGLPSVRIGFSVEVYDFAQSVVAEHFSSDHAMKIHCMSSKETLDAAMACCVDFSVVFLPRGHREGVVGEIPCQLTWVGSGSNALRGDAPGGYSDSSIDVATYGPTCPYRITTIDYLNETRASYRHDHEASSPNALNAIVASGPQVAPVPLFLTTTRYPSLKVLHGILPQVRLAVLSNSPTFRSRHLKRLMRIVRDLNDRISAAEAELRQEFSRAGE